MEDFAIFLSKLLLKYDHIRIDQLNDIRYGIEVILSNILSFLTILIFGFLYNQFSVTTLFLLIFISLRFLYEGYHANTFLSCLLLTVSSYHFCIIIYLFTPKSLNYGVNLGLCLINLILLICNKKIYKLKLFLTLFIFINSANLILSFYDFQYIFLYISLVNFVYILSDYYGILQVKQWNQQVLHRYFLSWNDYVSL